MHHEYPVLTRKGALVRTMTHAQEFPRDKIKCEAADKLCMASHVARRKESIIQHSPGSYPWDSWNKVKKSWIRAICAPE